MEALLNTIVLTKARTLRGRNMINNADYIGEFIQESIEILGKLDKSSIDQVVEVISQAKEQSGRIFFAGSGGGAGHSSHATCDFRKLAGIESYSISDNVSELTARVNDESWDVAYANWLKVSKLGSKDVLFVFSVGGGSESPSISANLVNAVNFANAVGAAVVGIVGRDGGHLSRNAKASIVVPTVNSHTVTAQVEGFQALLWHLVVTHPRLGGATPMWESQRA